MKTAALLAYRTYSIGTCSKEIIITDILGNTIAQETLYEQEGSHHLSYEAHHLSSGAYILSIRINDTRFTQHLSIIK